MFDQKYMIQKLKTYYGESEALCKERGIVLEGVWQAFKRRFPEAYEVLLLRVPARINLMGVHIDHRGGWCNYVPIVRETVMVFSPREDDQIVAAHVSDHFPERSFSIGERLPEEKRGDWLRFLKELEFVRGDWVNYLEGGALKLQDTLEGQNLRGVNLMVDGDIPMGSGLSSSSSLVVGVVMALREANRLELENKDLVEICGEGEWYVGTRGGAGDHAAMLLGKKGMMTHVGFKPLSYEHCPFPKGYVAVMAHSGIGAEKATQAREIFNLRIAAYEAAFSIYRESHPQWRTRLQYLRDITPENLETDLPTYYQSLKSVPVQANLHELREMYPQLREEWERLVSLFGLEEQDLPLREVLLFGVSECARAKRFAQWLGEGKVQKAGVLMYISHDGDRVTRWEGESRQEYRSPYEDAYLEALAEKAAEQGEVDEVRLEFQPGGYRCSLPELDRMVDCCRGMQGVAGAGLTGAGLGGSILVLVREENAEEVVEVLRSCVSSWAKEEPLAEICQPAAGAGLVE